MITRRSFIYILLLLMSLFSYAIHCKRVAILRATYTSSCLFNTTLLPSFPTWFQSPTTALQLLKINPVIESIDQQNTPTCFTASLTPIDITPSVKQSLQSVLITIQKINTTAVLIRMNQRNAKNAFTGNRIIVTILNTLPAVDVESDTVLRYSKSSFNATYRLHNQASLLVRFQLPSNFPLSIATMEKRGSKMLLRKLSKDMNAYNENIVALFEQQSQKKGNQRIAEFTNPFSSLCSFRPGDIFRRWKNAVVFSPLVFLNT